MGRFASLRMCEHCLSYEVEPLGPVSIYCVSFLLFQGLASIFLLLLFFVFRFSKYFFKQSTRHCTTKLWRNAKLNKVVCDLEEFIIQQIRSEEAKSKPDLSNDRNL